MRYVFICSHNKPKKRYKRKMVRFQEMVEGIADNDWDILAEWLNDRSRYVSDDLASYAAFCENIAIMHLFSKYFRPIQDVNGDLMGTAMFESNFISTQVLYKLGYPAKRTQCVALLCRTTNIKFIDWTINKYHITYDGPQIFDPVIEVHLVYRGFLLRAPSVGTLTDMKEAIGAAFEMFPQELIHEVCLYLFLPSHNKKI